MSSSFLALLFGLSLLHTSMAIKCITQPDYEEAKNFYRLFPKGEEHNPEKFKQEFLRVLKTRAEMDCAEIAREYGLVEPTHCATTDDLASCTRVVAAAFVKGFAPEEIRGIKLKECHFKEATRQIGLLSNNEWTPVNTCHLLEDIGCRGCQVCNESDFCNADKEVYGLRKIDTEKEVNGTTLDMNTTEVTEKPEEKQIQVESTTEGTEDENGTTEGKGTTEVTEKPEGKNGAGLTMNGGAPQALFLLLLAIATGAFRWTAFR